MHYFMTHYLFLAYGALAVGAMVSVRHDKDVRALGLALLAAWAVSNIVHEFLTFEWRVILYPMTDLMIALVARRVWKRTGYKIAGAITALSLANCMVNVAYAAVAMEAMPDIDLVGVRAFHTLASNLIFGSKCIILGVWGAADAYGWFDRIGGLPDRNRQSAGAYFAAKGDQE